MQFANTIVFLLAAMGAIASPVQPNSNDVGPVDLEGDGITYTGKCTRKTNECNFTASRKKKSVKCPSLPNKTCTKDGAKCTYDILSQEIVCY
ncbi:Antifungal protein [Colletotrichum spinosum]|uniref:Antifungal protein n=1 Tax=Colletotrichum spinosum TaxID=1347390 RepID=A0A4R8PXT8_9PEZI|nr:Antifungal protein [Colletotrichum spinosum]